MKIYIVISGMFDGCDIKAVFTTEEKAQEYIDLHQSVSLLECPTIVERETDPNTFRCYFNKRIIEDGREIVLVNTIGSEKIVTIADEEVKYKAAPADSLVLDFSEAE